MMMMMMMMMMINIQNTKLSDRNLNQCDGSA